MLDGLLSRGFSSKCKSLIKANRARIEVVRRRPEAKQRLLKEDLAKLLSNGLDINAYGRTEEYIAGMNLLSCYGFIELSGEFILKQLSGMQKRGDCPEECRQAVASLMFAAARFSDLPELRELRDIFQERYGSNLEVFVNQKFVENLSPRSPSTANKLRVLEDIASEFKIKWDSRGFEQRMASPSVVAKVGKQKAEIVAPRQVSLDEKYRKHDIGLKRDEVKHDVAKRKEAAVVYKEMPKRGESSSSAKNVILFEGSHFQTGNKYQNETGGRHNTERLSSSSNGKMLEKFHAGDARQGNGIYIPREIESANALIYQKAEVHPNFGGHIGKTEKPYYSDHRDSMKSSRNEPSERSEKSKGSFNYPPPPPPYIKSKDKIALPPYIKPKEDKTSRGPKHADENEHPPLDPSPFKLKSLNNFYGARDASDATSEDLLKTHSNYALPPPYVKSKDKIGDSSRKGNTISTPSEHAYHPKPSIVKTSGHEKEIVRENEDIPLPRPRSMRRKHHKSSSSSGYDIEGGRSSSTTRRSSSSRRREEHHQKRDDEERIIDELLIRYSKKPSSYDEEKLLRKKSSDGGEFEVVTRSVSLPHEVTTAFPESKKVLNRVNTFQPDNAAKHVHPKLPDYDDLAAKFNALRGR